MNAQSDYDALALLPFYVAGRTGTAHRQNQGGGAALMWLRPTTAPAEYERRVGFFDQALLGSD